MFSLRIVVRPVDHTALRVPNVLAIKAYNVAFLKSVHPRCNVDIVGNKHRLAGCEANDEPLMPTASKVIRQ